MSVPMKPPSPPIGVYTRSRERFLHISRTLDEPCVWLGGEVAHEGCEVVIVDAAIPSPDKSSRQRTKKGSRREGKVIWWQPGLVVYQCSDSVD